MLLARAEAQVSIAHVLPGQEMPGKPNQAVEKIDGPGVNPL
jgi:hypothetical protein